jgi:cell division protease FtsH
MSDKLDPMTLDEPQHKMFLGRDFGATPDYSQEIAFEIDKEVRRMIDSAFDRAKAIILEHRDKLDLMAQALIDRETLDKDELDAIFGGTWDEYLAKETAAREAAEADAAAEKPKRTRRKKADADADAAGESPAEVPLGAEPITGI